MINDGVGLPVGMRRRRMSSRQSLRRRFARRLDKIITGVQEWLEAPDTSPAKTAAYITCGAAVLMLLDAGLRMVLR